MTLPADVIADFRDTVQVAPRASVDADGKPTYGADVAHRARAVLGATRIVDDRGQDVLAAGMVQLTRRVAVATTDRLTVNAAEVTLLRVENSPDDLGQSATVLYFGTGAR